MPFIKMAECIPDRECLVKFSREDRNSQKASQIEICFPDVIKYGRETIIITKEMIGDNLEVPFKPGMVDCNADGILNGSGDLIIMNWL